LILAGANRKCEVPLDRTEEHFQKSWETSSCDPSIYPIHTREPMQLPPFDTKEVGKRMAKFENTAQGDNGLTYTHWRRLDPSCSLLTTILNTCLKHRRIPNSWKAATTILIYKKGDPENLSNWRPISLCRTLYKLYTGCLANRVTKWLISEEVISPCQKGFLPADGAFEHVYTLQRRIETARTH